jgi:hypothetical protein
MGRITNPQLLANHWLSDVFADLLSMLSESLLKAKAYKLVEHLSHLKVSSLRRNRAREREIISIWWEPKVP